tara:strand:- start:857 stop:1090 length:234 start_codon:yes stop_codon:yes gene_type:complete
MLEQEDSAKKAEKYQESRIMAFDQLEQKLENIKKALRQSKIETITYYRDNPKSYAVIKPTDIIGDYIKDIETLLNKN